jgi:hypothetical protein
MISELLKEKLEKQGGRVFERELSNLQNITEKTFAICVETDDEDSLERLKVYEVTLSKTDYVGVTDKHGEKLICPANCFVYLDLPPKISRLLEQTVALSS